MAEPQPYFQRYRRLHEAITEMADWFPSYDMTKVSISSLDRSLGSPKLGDKIARNPTNRSDQWLVSEEYFNQNFEPSPIP